MIESAVTAPFRFSLDGSSIAIGRDQSCTICVQGMGISRQHALILLDPSAPLITDVGSTFGIRLDDQPVQSGALDNGTVITIGIRRFTVKIANRYLELVTETAPESSGTALDLPPNAELKIGRDPSCEIPLDHPLVSRVHAVIHRSDSSMTIADRGSTNGTYVNGLPVTHAKINEGDIIQIGPYRLFMEQGAICRSDDRNRIRLETFGLWVRRRGIILLSDINLSIAPGEFVVVLGASGAGKTTLSRALTGQLPAWKGGVYVNGLPLHRFLGAFSSSIGYVSQENLLCPELTVEETYHEQCLLRLPRDSTLAERKLRINETIALLDLERVASRRINSLSGGEAKRVHLGIELLASPAVIFLDEPLSGLDPGLVRKFMQLFRRISDRGHTLVLTTHTLEQIELCDRILFMHRSKLLFQGPPCNLLDTFEARSLPEVYERVTLPGATTIIDLLGSSQGNRAAPPADTHRSSAMKIRRPRAISFMPQFVMLANRYRRILIRDRRNALLMAAQAPLIALLLSFVFKGDTGFLPISFYFCVTISAIWIGGINSIRDIAREWTLLARERRAGLSLVAYICSKIMISTALAAFQGIVFSTSLSLLFADFKLDLMHMMLVLAGTVSGALLGLCISSWSGNVSRAINLLPIIFIPQIFFSGILIPFDRMTVLGRLLSNITISRPVFSLFKQACILHQDLRELSEWQGLGLLNATLIILMMIAVWSRLARGRSGN